MKCSPDSLIDRIGLCSFRAADLDATLNFGSNTPAEMHEDIGLVVEIHTLEIEKLFDWNSESLGDSLQATDRRRVYATFDKANEIIRIAGGLRQISLCQVGALAKLGDPPSKFLFDRHYGAKLRKA